MYYRLKEPWTFRGFKKLPYALRREYGEKKHEKPLFIEKEVFIMLLDCDGQTDIDLDKSSKKMKEIFEEFLEQGILEASSSPLPALQSWQRYIIYPSRYIRNVHWSITGKCNFRCRHCLVSAPEAKHPQLPLEDCLHIIDEIASCGIRLVDITGGEPLLRKDFDQIVKALSKYGIDIGVIFTNASLLNENILQILRDNHQHPNFQLSFDGLGHHDWLRGVKGAEKDADRAFRLLQKEGFRTIAAMCIHKENKDSLRETIRYLAGLGVLSLRVNAPQSLGLWKQYEDKYALSKEETAEIYKECITHYFEDGMPLELELDGYFQCKKGETDYTIPLARHFSKGPENYDFPYCEAVRYNAYIGPDGKLAPCMGFSDTVLKDRFPSVLKEHLGQLSLNGYYNDLVNTKLSDLLNKNEECRTCLHLNSCLGGCMLEGMDDEGDFLHPDPHSCFFHKHVGEEAIRKIADEAIEKYCK